MIVLGVDPGSRVTGYGLVEKGERQMSCLHAGTFGTSLNRPFFERIYEIFQSMTEIMNRFRPEEMAIEDLFFHKNLESALKIGHARGAVQNRVKIFEYSPLEIKKSVVGYGRATKEQVRSMTQVILKMKTLPPLDASDALAAAICHLNWTRFRKNGS